MDLVVLFVIWVAFKRFANNKIVKNIAFIIYSLILILILCKNYLRQFKINLSSFNQPKGCKTMRLSQDYRSKRHMWLWIVLDSVGRLENREIEINTLKDRWNLALWIV